jgi:hypothetical protein
MRITSILSDLFFYPENSGKKRKTGSIRSGLVRCYVYDHGTETPGGEAICHSPLASRSRMTAASPLLSIPYPPSLPNDPSELREQGTG